MNHYFVYGKSKVSDNICKFQGLIQITESYYNNNQFVGTWKGYDNANVMTANWGDGRIPQSGDLDAGSSEFAVRYIAFWLKIFLN